jgi:transcriptional regulator with XRE-family HTH domain
MEQISGGPLTLARVLTSIRECEEISQSEFARKLKISRQLLNDIEHGRRHVNLEKAARFARALGHPESYFIKLALQALVDEAGLDLKVDVA